MTQTRPNDEPSPIDFNPQRDEHRSAILRMLNSLEFPQGWRVILGMDNSNGKIRLEVQVATRPYSLRLFGMMIFDKLVTWETRREISATTYQALYLLLKTQPEFLEMHTVIGCKEFALAGAC